MTDCTQPPPNNAATRASTRAGFYFPEKGVARTTYQHPAAESGAQREKLHALPYDLFPFQEVAEAFSRVAEHGAEKYSAWNWSQGLPQVQIMCSLLRHLWAYMRGQDRDSSSGLLHTDHILWNAVVLAHHVYWNINDNRRKEPVRSYHNQVSDGE